MQVRISSFSSSRNKTTSWANALFKLRLSNKDTTPLNTYLLLHAIYAQDKKSSYICVINGDSDDIFPLYAQNDALLNMPSTEDHFVAK